MNKVFVLLFIFISINQLSGQDISFYKENITMKIDQGYFYVTGNYYLETTGDRSIALVYPFPRDTLVGEVDSVRVFDMTFDNPIEILEQKREGIVFKAEFGDSTKLDILITYRQKLLGNRAVYILKTTAGWKKPLEQANYELITPIDMQITSFSIPPDESVVSGDEKVYFWSKTNYMPGENMVFSW